MRTFFASVGVVLSATLLAVAEPVPLFNVKDFTGWEGDTAKTWRIEDGVIVGGSLDVTVPRNEFLCTTKTYGDFELTVVFKLLGDKEKVNAGVQFRSKRIPNHHEVIGYQADVGQGYWGSLYDESRRNKVLVKPGEEMIAKLVKYDDWNEYKIRCEGPSVRLWLNGVRTVDYTEDDNKIDRTGIIGLQVHGGAKAKVFYKSVVIEELPAHADGPFTVATAKPGDAVTVRTDDGKTVFDVTSKSGIGSATIERQTADWPKEVVLRLRLTGLEQLEITCGKRCLVVAVDGHDGKLRVRTSSREGKDETELDTKSPFWPAVGVVGADGKPAGALPLREGGYFEVAVPAALLADGPKSLEMKWIDFFRR